MSMIVSRDSNGGSNRIPLKWADGYFLSRDGVVSRADGRALKDVPLAQARRYARQDIQHDPLREAASGVTHGRGGSEELVFMEDGACFVRLVRMMSEWERAQLSSEGASSAFVGFPMRAEGDTERGWYWLRADDGAWWLFHAPSYARHLLGANQ